MQHPVAAGNRKIYRRQKMGFVLIHIAYFFLKLQYVSYFSCFTSINFSKPSWRILHAVVFFLQIPLILWIGLNSSTKCGRVHFEHSHRKWLVITVRPTTSVRESPQKNLPPRNTPDLFCRRFTPTKSSLRCMGGIFLQIEPYVVVQISEFYLQLLTVQPQSVILVLERSRT